MLLGAGLPEVGDLIAGKYRLRGVLGRGGMGVVFDAHHELLDRRVALKVLAPEVVGNREVVTRFMNEARAAARITSDHVVNMLDVGSLDSGLPYMVMERLEGVDLGELLARQGSLPIPVVVDLLVEAAEGVSHAHLEEIIHRDLKPSNLFLATKPDRTQVVKVLDFGISKLHQAAGAGSVTSTSAILGSPLYMSPEQLRSSKSIDLRADIWSLGVIACELLTGKVPFEGDNLVELFAIIQVRDAEPLWTLRADIPPALDETVRRCLRRSPEERFPTAYALARALVPFGGPKAAASLQRLEAHLSAKGRSVQELSSTLPESRSSVPVAAARVTPVAIAAMAAPSASTPPTMPSDAAPPREGQATAAPWSSTGRTSTGTTRTAAGVSVAGVLATLALVGSLAFVFLRPQPQSSAAAGPSPSASTLEAVVMAPPALAAAPVTTAVALDASAGDVAEPAEASVASSHAVPAHGGHAGSAAPAAHHVGAGAPTASPASPAAPPQPPASPPATTNPLIMKPL